MRNINKISTQLESDINGNVDLEIHGLKMDRLYSAEPAMYNYRNRARRLVEYQIAYLNKHVDEDKRP